jgi:hypothetical protein
MSSLPINPLRHHLPTLKGWRSGAVAQIGYCSTAPLHFAPPWEVAQMRSMAIADAMPIART